MQTYTHILLTAALNRGFADRINQRNGFQVDGRALLIGSFLPDVPLVLLSLGFFVQRFWLSEMPPADGVFGAAYDALYFENPVWIIGHSVFHSPLLIALYLLVGYLWGVRGKRPWLQSLFWFGVGCGLHSFVDILTHHHDGPLLFFPLDWQTRFSSPVSYWDPNYYAGFVAPLEHLMDVTLIGYLLWMRYWRDAPSDMSSDVD